MTAIDDLSFIVDMGMDNYIGIGRLKSTAYAICPLLPSSTHPNNLPPPLRHRGHPMSEARAEDVGPRPLTRITPAELVYSVRRVERTPIQNQGKPEFQDGPNSQKIPAVGI